MPGIGETTAQAVVAALADQRPGQAVNVTTGEVLEEGATTEAEAGECPSCCWYQECPAPAVPLRPGPWRTAVVRSRQPAAVLVLETLAAIASRGEIDRLAVVVDVRSGRFFGELAGWSTTCAPI